MIHTSNLQIPLGVQLYNENKLDEMGKVFEHFMTLVQLCLLMAIKFFLMGAFSNLTTYNSPKFL